MYILEGLSNAVRFFGAIQSRVERLDAKIANASEGLKGAKTNDDDTLYAFEPIAIEDAIARFITFFNFGSDSGEHHFAFGSSVASRSCGLKLVCAAKLTTGYFLTALCYTGTTFAQPGTTLCQPCVVMLEQIRALTSADASTYEDVSNGGMPDINGVFDTNFLCPPVCLPV